MQTPFTACWSYFDVMFGPLGYAVLRHEVDDGREEDPPAIVKVFSTRDEAERFAQAENEQLEDN